MGLGEAGVALCRCGQRAFRGAECKERDGWSRPYRLCAHARPGYSPSGFGLWLLFLWRGYCRGRLCWRCRQEGAKCLVRATDGKKKISCAVLAKDSIRFQLDLMDVVKAHTNGLKNKPKKTRVKTGKKA
eukprot:TRINITY_DN1674_c0_g1_i5.p3 TRINITY_DN1674_c0_g1~~TRINITY_DN1674_c0_g1_i5.p3  ORF type:complete len:129 (-),score=14.23 TRINITY_DN1674_c0_g1_i5:125-511(-)